MNDEHTIWMDQQDKVANRLALHILSDNEVGQLLRQWNINQPYVKTLESVHAHPDYDIWRMNLDGENVEMNVYLWNQVIGCLMDASSGHDYGQLGKEALDYVIALADEHEEGQWGVIPVNPVNSQGPRLLPNTLPYRPSSDDELALN